MEGRAIEGATMLRARTVARELNLEMKIGEVEYQADKRKATFYYIADDRVDFRELIKIYAREFHVKISMRQIGARQEAGKIGGIGSCGRELCCATWLTDFKSVGTMAARYQNLSINQSKLSGQCGRLKCCLNYELDTYLDALQEFPKDADMLQTQQGEARLIKTDIFKKLMVYEYQEGARQYPLTLDKVREIQAMKATGKMPDHLEMLSVESTYKTNPVDNENVIGEVTLKTLETAERKKKNFDSRQPRQRQGDPLRDINKKQDTGKQDFPKQNSNLEKPQNKHYRNKKNRNNNRPDEPKKT
jgi:hypothetical protein